MKIDLVLHSEAGDFPPWELGETKVISPDSDAINAMIDEDIDWTTSDAWLFWDAKLGAPDAATIKSILETAGDIWHAGLKLGTGNLPQVLDFVHPTWMLNRDADFETAATSWRLSLSACLVRTRVLREMGGLRSGFETLNAAGLEWGHRLVKLGVMMRYVPDMLSIDQPVSQSCLSPYDELLFAKCRFSPFWFRWVIFRLLCSGELPRFMVLGAWRGVNSFVHISAGQGYRHDLDAQRYDRRLKNGRVTVLLPTINRYPYLAQLLEQLRAQTVPPYEIVVIDQTPHAIRNRRLPKKFNDLPLKWIERDEAGQCSSRNAGLRVSTGEFVLFLDDDDEIDSDLIERHLSAMEDFHADVSNGVADEVGVDTPPDEYAVARQSDVFPTNNTMIRRRVLLRSGLFDQAYDRGKRADGDLGMRVYLSGHHMVLSPEISVLHHRAPMGGLRTHGQRVVTRASSRKSLTQSNLVGAYDIYLARRYFSARQVREMLWISVFSTLSIHGSSLQKMLKGIIGVFLLPRLLRRLAKSRNEAESMLKVYPKIETLP